MTSTKNTIAAKGRETLPAWVNLDALGLDWKDVEYRRDLEATGRLLVDELARWAKAMMPVSEWPHLEIEGPAYDLIKTYLGFDTIDYVVGFIDEIKGMLEERDNAEAYEEWTNDPDRRDVWESPNRSGWIALGLGEPAGLTYAEQVIKKAGGTVTWPEGGAS